MFTQSTTLKSASASIRDRKILGILGFGDIITHLNLSLCFKKVQKIVQRSEQVAYHLLLICLMFHHPDSSSKTISIAVGRFFLRPDTVFEDP